MTSEPASGKAPFNVMIVAQSGRVGYEAALFAASLRASDPGFEGRLIVAEPQPGPLWPSDPRIADPDLRALLVDDLKAEIMPFENRHFGAAYPQGNKIEALVALPEAPFIFFDSDTLITGPLSSISLDFNRPSASLRREGTWPKPEIYGPGYTAIWSALYAKFGLNFESSLDYRQPDEYWRRYLYFNAGWFFHSSPQCFGKLFTHFATDIRDDPPTELSGQSLMPWLDQIALPLVVHALGGTRQPILAGQLDGEISCHYRSLSLLYARERGAVVDLVEQITAPNRMKKVLKRHDPIRKMVLQGKGIEVRNLFDRDEMPRTEKAIRNRIKRARLWMR